MKVPYIEVFCNFVWETIGDRLVDCLYQVYCLYRSCLYGGFTGMFLRR